MSFEFFISGRYLKAKKNQAFISLITILSVVGIMIGVMALIIVIAVMSGAESEFRSRILGVEPHIVLQRYDGPFVDYSTVIKEVEKIKGIESASPFIYTQVMLRSSSNISGAVLKGIDPDASGCAVANYDSLSLHEKFKTNQANDAASFSPGIILGKTLAQNLGVTQGDEIYLISPKGMLSPIGHIPSMKRFTVTGFFQSGMYEYDASLAYIYYKDAQKMLRMGDAVTGIGIQIKDIYHADVVSDSIVNILNSKHGAFFGAQDWMQKNHNLFSALKLEKNVMFIILTLIILVAAFNIASTLIMMVMGKTRDIAILKAMGATDKSIRKIFIIKGMVIGAIGTSCGILFGSVGCFLLKHYKFIEIPGDVYFFTTLPVELQVVDVVVIACAAMAICFLSTLYPSRKASKLNPVEALRYG